VPDHIIVAVDGGRASRAALRWVAEHVGPRTSTIEVVSVIGNGDEQSRERLRPATVTIVDSAVAALRLMLPSATISSVVRDGDPVDELVDATRGADLLVIGTNRDVDSVAGATTLPLELSARSLCTTVVVPAEWVPGSGPVIAATAHDSASDTVVDFALGAAERRRTSVTLLHTWSAPTIGYVDVSVPADDAIEPIPDGQAAALDAMASTVRVYAPAGVKVTAKVTHGDPVHQLVEAGGDAGLIVLGRHSTSPTRRRLLGSVGRGVLLRPPCPVAIEPPAVESVGIRVTPETIDEDW
jgi:nucleotide-binding universal stress UspA family protein